MDMEQTTSPEYEELEVESEEVESNEDAELDIEGDEQGEEPQAAEQDDDSEELEFNGENYKLPKRISEAVRSMQKDYTVKTQSLAEQRKTFESEAQFRQENINEIAEVVSLDKKILEYKALDWNKISVEDPQLFQQLRFQYDELKESRSEIASKLAHKHEQETLSKQQESVKLIQESESVLRRDIKDWSSDLERKLQDYAVKELGFDLENVVKSKADPRLYKLLHKAYVGEQLIKKQTSKPVNVPKKAEPVTVVSGRGVVNRKSPADMSDTEYAKWRKQAYK